jgi:hypothetical protein
MSYAIVQKELVVPDVERLARAFSVLADLTAIDAQNAANDAYGILWRGLTGEQAGALQAALTHEGLETEMVDDAELPALVVPRAMAQVQFQPEFFVVTDPLKRVIQVPWNEVLLVASGAIRPERRRGAGPDTENAENEMGQMTLDLFLVDRTTRFEAVAAEFNFGHLGPRLTEDMTINHLFLVQEIEEHVPHASLNQGAYLACQKPPEVFSYPSKHAYQEELTWLLWRIERLAAASPPQDGRAL